jgi:hypothetical protein
MIAAKQALKRARENNAVFYSASTLVTIAIIAIITPFISANEYLTTDFDRILHAPELAAMHLFGTVYDLKIGGKSPDDIACCSSTHFSE